MWDSFGKDACRGIRKIRFILLPSFSSQLSFVLGNFNYFLTRQHVPKCACFLADRQWGVSSPVSILLCRSVGFCGC